MSCITARKDQSTCCGKDVRITSGDGRRHVIMLTGYECQECNKSYDVK